MATYTIGDTTTHTLAYGKYSERVDKLFINGRTYTLTCRWGRHFTRDFLDCKYAYYMILTFRGKKIDDMQGCPVFDSDDKVTDAMAERAESVFIRQLKSGHYEREGML